MAFLSFAQAQQNASPSARHCRSLSGIPWIVFLEKDDSELCLLGSGAIGSYTLFSENLLNIRTLAVKKYKATHISHCDDLPLNAQFEYCVQSMGSLIHGVASDHKIFNLCQFEDKSTIELTTLCRGYKHKLHVDLDQNLLH